MPPFVNEELYRQRHEEHEQQVAELHRGQGLREPRHLRRSMGRLLISAGTWLSAGESGNFELQKSR